VKIVRTKQRFAFGLMKSSVKVCNVCPADSQAKSRRRSAGRE